jgi:hypothetical protein
MQTWRGVWCAGDWRSLERYGFVCRVIYCSDVCYVHLRPKENVREVGGSSTGVCR